MHDALYGLICSAAYRTCYDKNNSYAIHVTSEMFDALKEHPFFVDDSDESDLRNPVALGFLGTYPVTVQPNLFGQWCFVELPPPVPSYPHVRRTSVGVPYCLDDLEEDYGSLA